MARVFVTGSADGLGLLAVQQLIDEGHEVIGHGRNDARAKDLKKSAPKVQHVVTGDLSGISETKSIAAQVEKIGPLDAIIHNAGVGFQEQNADTADGLNRLFAINVLAPYLLTALIPAPKRLVYLSSGMHGGGSPDLSDAQWKRRSWNSSQAYSDSKLFDLLLAFGVARKWPKVLSNGVHPGWVPTKMGGRGAPDDLTLGARTQVWLAVSNEPKAQVSGKYFFHQKERSTKADAHSVEAQDALLDYCAKLSGVKLPSEPRHPPSGAS